MKRYLTALALAGAFFLGIQAGAQSTVITASNIVDVGGNPVTGRFCLTPAQQFVRGGGGNVVTTQVCYTITAGVLQSGVVLADTSLTNPANVCYQVAILNAYSETVARYGCFQPSGATYSFDSFVQAAPPFINTSFTVPTFSTNGVLNAGQSQLNIVATSPLTATNSGSTVTFGCSGCSGSGGSMTWPAAAGITVYVGGNAWGTSLAAPSGAIVGTTDIQTLTNKTVDGVTPATMAYLDATGSIQTQLNGKQAALGFTPLNPANNLSDLGNAATALANLGAQAALGYTPVPNTRTINGHALSADVIVSASDLTTGTLPHTQLPALQSADITGALGFTPYSAANPNGYITSASQVVQSLTTNGSSGPATLISGVLNIPQYAGGGSMTWPAAAGIPVYAGGNAWGTSLAAPSGAIVGTTDTQTLTNKTLDGVLPGTMAYLDATSSIQTQLNGKQAALGFTPLNPANNLSDLGNAATALANLGAQAALGYTPVPNTRTINGHALSADVIVSASDIGLGNLTNDAQTKAAIVPNTVPIAGQVPVGNSGGTAYAPVAISGDCTLTAAGALTCTKSNGSAFGSAAFTASSAYDVAGAASTAQTAAETYAENASNLSSGTINAARLPAALANSTSVNGTPIPASSTLIANPYPVKIWIPAAECNNATAGAAWDLPTSNAAAPACKTGTNTQQGVLTFADGSSAQFELILPSDWTSTNGFASRILFSSSATSGTVIFNIATSCTAPGATDDGAFNSATAYATITQSAANVLQNPQATAISTIGCAANDYLHIRITRATDTASDTAVAVRGIEFDFWRTL